MMDERINEIKEKLTYIPVENDETMQYYIFYKEDVRYLLEKIEHLEDVIKEWREDEGLD